MQNEMMENYEVPELFELGQAEELTLGLDDGYMADIRGGWRIQPALVLETDAE